MEQVHSTQAQLVFDNFSPSCYNLAMMSTEATILIAGYRLPVVIERVNGSYQATSPALDGFLVLADSLEEVLALAPGVARALQLPTQIEVLVPA
jgi:hypothetical protein